MKKTKKGGLLRIWDDVLRIGTFTVFVFAVLIMVIAAADGNNAEEAPMGDFSTGNLNEGWRLVENGTETAIELPTSVERKPGEEIVIVNRLPDDLTDGMSLTFRPALEDIIVSIDGEVRAEYTSDSIEGMSFYIPSAYVVVELSDADAGKEIRVDLRVKTKGVLHGVKFGYGNNAWYAVLQNGIPVLAIAAVVLILGILLLVTSLFLGRAFRIGASRQLAILMIDIALWVFSESTIRQFIFSRPSLSQYFAYLTVELIGAFSCMYFDEVQHRIYHKRYMIAESLAFVQIVINILLHMTGLCPFYRTLVMSHIWTGVCAVIAIICMVEDFRSKRVREYRITMVGMILFVVFSLGELAGFYISRYHQLGVFLCLALIMLMTATIIQMVYDEVTSYEAREKDQTAMTITTIETIAGAIDARDEYTGGHSERVGFYAGRLAREMAADYDLSEEDILRVHYIGLVHDIGKIGVADNVLNKVGWLTEEEFSLMKKHTEIGYEIMSTMGGSIKGLLDGIRYHHERFDGKGYPDGLSDTDIPLIARILSLADSYDAMTSNRVYRKRLTDDEVRNEIRRCSGTQFDPALAEIFLKLLDKGELSAVTVDGKAADLSGTVRTSSKLEGRLQKDMLAGKPIENPAHVRMLCYIMKLMEKKGKEYRILYVGVAGREHEEEGREAGEIMPMIREALRENIAGHDINIEYTATRNIVALYDRSEEETDAFIRRITALCPMASVEAQA
ncbi:MAG: HD-GYP domain-containing protein [Lachnospiraceae bacterium]|nr:HD-GYP domain-containing protein [Lachnospiraceae bacterium]